MSYYYHNVPGRMRIKCPTLKNNPSADNHIQNLLSTIPGINKTEINPVTGSLLIKYSPESIAERDILSVLQNNGYFEPSRATHINPYIDNLSREVISRLVTGLIKQFAA